jgi:hypothetical protein
MTSRHPPMASCFVRREVPEVAGVYLACIMSSVDCFHQLGVEVDAQPY